MAYKSEPHRGWTIHLSRSAKNTADMRYTAEISKGADFMVEYDLRSETSALVEAKRRINNRER